MTVFELFIKTNRLKKKDIAKYLNVSSAFVTQLSQGLRDIPLDKLALIKANERWNTEMLDREGDMLKSDKQKYNEVKEVDPNYIDVPLVTIKAQAGYLSHFGDDIYIKELPTVKVHADRTFHGQYRCFEVAGDSMNDGTLKSICDGDTIFCREVKRDLWSYKLHFTQWFFVINHIDGLLVKQIVDHDVENGVITCHSLNPVYGEDFKLNLNEVRELYNVIKITDRVIKL